MGWAYAFTHASSSRRVWHGLATAVDSIRNAIHALRCGFLCLKIHRASRPARGKPILISILAFSVVFHAISLECSSFRENSTYFSTYTRRWIRGIVVEWFMAREVRCGVTDCLQTDTHDNTVTVTAHACRRLIIGWQYWEFHKPTQTLLKLDFTKIVPFQKNGPNHTITIEFGTLRRIKYKVGSRDTSLIHQCAHVIYI